MNSEPSEGFEVRQLEIAPESREIAEFGVTLTRVRNDVSWNGDSDWCHEYTNNDSEFGQAA